MLRSINAILGYQADATDGKIGSLDDAYFDDLNWTIRYFVIDTGKWLPGRRVLVSPTVVGEPAWTAQTVPINLNKKLIETSPSIALDEPVSHKFEIELASHYGWPHYTIKNVPAEDPKKPNLRSLREVTSYAISATDGDIGHVEEVIADTETLKLRYFVVDTRNWLPGKKTLIGMDWIESVSWTDHAVRVNLTQKAIKEGPEFDPKAPVNPKLEQRLYDYYGRPTGQLAATARH